MLLDNISTSTAAIVIVLTGLLLLARSWASPALDPLEPPLLKPRIPILGHIISMIKEKAGFYDRLFKEGRMPICTLPMLNGKLYVINSPSLIQSALRNSDISFIPFIIEFSKTMFGQTRRQVDIISQPSVLKDLLDIIHSSLLGESLHKLSSTALTQAMSHLNGVPPMECVKVPDAFIWLRDIMTEATARAMFGEKNPITAEHVHLLWAFDRNSALLALDFAPNLIARDSLLARQELNKLLLQFYQARHELEPDVSDLVRRRTAVLRAAGYDDEDISIMELMIPWVGSTNTIPTLFWLFVNLFSRPESLSRVRAEMDAITVVENKPEGRLAVVNVGKLEEHCPLFNAFYQETLRVYIHSVGNRRVMKDTKIQDSDGHEYLLKQGVNVQWPPMVTHFLGSVWGDDSQTFDPERFMDATAHEDKIRRGAMLPFGGGRHLCPGRKLAFAQILGFVGVVALGFEVEGLVLPESTDPVLGSAPRRPDYGGRDSGFALRRREGWEDVTWTVKE